MLIAYRRWSGFDAILYYIGDVFQDLGLTGGTTALLATGVTGVVFFVSTIPALVHDRNAGYDGTILIALAHNRLRGEEANVDGRLSGNVHHVRCVTTIAI